MKDNKGALSIELALVLPVIIFIFMFFYNILFSINVNDRIKSSIHKISEGIKTDIYLAQKVDDILELGLELKEIIDIINQKFNIDIDYNKLGNYMYENMLSNYIKHKLYAEFSSPVDYNLVNKKFRLKDNISIDIALKEDFIEENISYEFDFKNIFPVFNYYKVDFKHILSSTMGRDDNIKNDENKKSDGANRELYYTRNGLNKSGVYHVNKDCFGLRFASEIKIIKSNSNFKKGNNVVISGKEMELCPFCKINKKAK